jgi:mannosyl-glycoprotein endo-beta-N-acetylglucosaminidase
MALLVATSGNPKRAARGAHGIANAQSSDSHGGGGGGAGAGDSSRSTSTARATTTTAPAAANASTAGTSLTSTRGSTVPTNVPPAPATTTTAPVVAPTTTTTVTSPPLGAGSHQGVIEPPAQRSSSVGFTGTGAMQISVVWSGPTYLTMQVSCPNGTQNVGGSSAMAASLPDASGSCLATVSEPTSESTALTYTITIGPAGG